MKNTANMSLRDDYVSSEYILRMKWIIEWFLDSTLICLETSGKTSDFGNCTIKLNCIYPKSFLRQQNWLHKFFLKRTHVAMNANIKQNIFIFRLIRRMDFDEMFQ